jgi:hypothetical protein
MAREISDDLARFLHGEVDPMSFHHLDHVRTAFEILKHHAFMDAALAYSAGLKVLARKAGRPEAYHETITLAFLSLIAERVSERAFEDFESFAAANPDLMEKSALSRWYAPERLNSDRARKVFVLPDPVGLPPPTYPLSTLS